MSFGFSWTSVLNEFSSYISQNTYTKILTEVSNITVQVNEIDVVDSEDITFDNITMQNDLKTSVVLKMIEEAMASEQVSEDGQTKLEKTMETSGIGALSVGVTNITNILRQRVDNNSVTEIVRHLRNQATNQNILNVRSSKRVSYKDLVMNNREMNDAVLDEYTKTWSGIVAEIKQKLEDKEDMKTKGLDLTTVLIAAAVIGVGILALIGANNPAVKKMIGK